MCLFMNFYKVVMTFIMFSLHTIKIFFLYIAYLFMGKFKIIDYYHKKCKIASAPVSYAAHYVERKCKLDLDPD